MSKKPRPMEADGLAKIECWETNDPTVFGLEMIDGKGRSFTAAANSSGIVHVIGKLFDQANHATFAAATNLTEPVKAQCPTHASRLELGPGRSPTEVAAKMTMGCIELVVFLPLPEVMQAIADLAEKIESTDAPVKPH